MRFLSVAAIPSVTENDDIILAQFFELFLIWLRNIKNDMMIYIIDYDGKDEITDTINVLRRIIVLFRNYVSFNNCTFIFVL